MNDESEYLYKLAIHVCLSFSLSISLRLFLKVELDEFFLLSLQITRRYDHHHDNKGYELSWLLCVMILFCLHVMNFLAVRKQNQEYAQK